MPDRPATDEFENYWTHAPFPLNDRIFPDCLSFDEDNGRHVATFSRRSRELKCFEPNLGAAENQTEAQVAGRRQLAVDSLEKLGISDPRFMAGTVSDAALDCSS